VRFIPSPDRRAEVLARVARVLAGAGQHGQAARVAEQAEAATRSITSPDRHPEVLAQVVEALARAGQHEQAEAATRSIIDPY